MNGGRRTDAGLLRFRPTTELRHISAATLVGLTALVFSALYLVSDVIEAIQGGFSDGQLWLTLVAEAAIPLFVIGLIRCSSRRSDDTGTVVYALIDGTPDYGTLSLAGLGFGAATVRARVLPRWTGVALMAGVVLVSLSQTLPEGPQVLAAAIRDLGFAGMGAALLGIHATPVSAAPRTG